MYVHPDAVINTFIDVKIPTPEELMKRIGLRVPQGHPDRVSDDIYTHPSNIHDVPAHDKYLHEFGELANSLVTADEADVSSEAMKDAEEVVKSVEETIE